MWGWGGGGGNRVRTGHLCPSQKINFGSWDCGNGVGEEQRLDQLPLPEAPGLPAWSDWGQGRGPGPVPCPAGGLRPWPQTAAAGPIRLLGAPDRLSGPVAFSRPPRPSGSLAAPGPHSGPASRRRLQQRFRSSAESSIPRVGAARRGECLRGAGAGGLCLRPMLAAGRLERAVRRPLPRRAPRPRRSLQSRAGLRL